VIKKLVNIKSDFEKCKQFTYRVDCYRLCPKIDENGDLQEAHREWKRDCT
jgi:hypothetical protein